MLLYIPYDSGVRKSCALPHNTAANNARIKVVLRIIIAFFVLYRLYFGRENTIFPRDLRFLNLTINS